MDKDKKLMEDSWWDRLTEGELGLVLMGGAMLSKSLIQFSVDGQGCVPSLLFDPRPNYGGNEDNGDLLQGPMQTLLHWVPPTLQDATADPYLHQRLLDTHGQVWVSLFWGHCFFLLGPCEYKALFVLSQSLFPQSCVLSGGSIVGLMATSSKRAYAIPWSAAPRVSVPVVGRCWPVPLQETFTHSPGSVSAGSLGPGAHTVCLSPPSVSGRYGVWF